MNPTALHHMVVSSGQPHADFLLSMEAERMAGERPVVAGLLQPLVRRRRSLRSSLTEPARKTYLAQCSAHPAETVLAREKSEAKGGRQDRPTPCDDPRPHSGGDPQAAYEMNLEVPSAVG
jgi:hypothetical protein